LAKEKVIKTDALLIQHGVCSMHMYLNLLVKAEKFNCVCNFMAETRKRKTQLKPHVHWK